MSEFGRGLTYCLGLFLSHSERDYKPMSEEVMYGCLFNGAGDHLFELEIPDKLPTKLKKRLKTFKDKVLGWRLSNPTKQDWIWAIQEAKDLLREIDKEFKIKTEKGEWE